MSDDEGRMILVRHDEPKWKSTLRELIGSEPGFSERFDYKKEREEWDATLTLRG